MTSYFEKALGTPTGQKLAQFYIQGDKQVRDIHAEARRLADLRSGKGNEGEGATENKKSGEPEFKEHEKSATGPAADIAASSEVAPLGEKA